MDDRVLPRTGAQLPDNFIGPNAPGNKKEHPGTDDIGTITDSSGLVRSFVCCIKFETTRAPQFIDITKRVQQYISKSNISNGLVVIYSKHTTAAIKINENEPLLIEDMERFLERMSPRNDIYKHNDFTVRTVNMNEDECPNGHSHCQHLLLGASETVPIMDGVMIFGQWQSIFLIELDHPREREVIIQVMGVPFGA